MRPVEKVLGRLEGVVEANGSWKALCPAHRDRVPSLSVSEGDDGRVLLKCFAGCGIAKIVARLGLEMRDLFERRNGHRKNHASTPPKIAATVQRCTLEEYAEAKGLPTEYLKRLGLSDRKYQGRPAVRIPYTSANGSEMAVRFRIALDKSEGGDDRFRWRSGDKASLYGLHRIEKIAKAGYVVLVEGESDAQTLWYHGISALGIPGADTWKSAWASPLEGVERIYAVIESDAGGETLREKLAATPEIRDRLHLVRLGKHKDASGLYLSDPGGFKERLMAALKDAMPLADELRLEREAEARRAWAECRDLVLVPNILERFADDLARSGVAGESRAAKILYLAVTSRLLARPVSIAMKGPSSGGKSYLTEQVLSFFPEGAYYALTAMSEHALAYSDEPLVNRILVIYEAAGMESEFQTYLIRSLLSEGRVRYETVEKTSEGMKPRLIERAGPTGLIVTTTKTRMHPENETRLISLTVTDTRDQTRDVMASLASEAAGEGPDLGPWHALQGWLGGAGAERRTTIPYAGVLASLVPPVAVRLRRDFGAILNLIRAHAILHQATRDRDDEGRVVATVGDYAAVRELAADLISEGIDATVPPTVRETVEKVSGLYADDSEPVTVARLAKELKLDKSAASRRVRSATERGYLKNLEDRRGRPSRLVPGEPLPDDLEILPGPEELNRCTVAGVREGVNENYIDDAAEEAGNKKFSATPSRNGSTVQPLSHDLSPGETATLEDLKRRREGSDREMFSI